jgi:hypothetical protein
MMKRGSERGRDVEPAEVVSETAESGRQRPRWLSEAVVAAIPKGGEPVAAAPAKRPRRPRTRVVSEAIVAALSDERRTPVVSEAVVAAVPAEAEVAPGGGADDEAEAGA